MRDYLVGVNWRYWHAPLPRTTYEWAESVLLLVLPLGIPVVLALTFITFTQPVSSLYGIPLLWVIPHAVSLSLGLVWLALSVWVITRGEGSSGLARSLGWRLEIGNYS
jgi:hypothetical protein